MLSEPFKKKLYRTEIILIIALVIVIPLALFHPSITGYVPSDLFKQTLNFTLDKSQALNLKADGQPVYISSLSLSGDVKGDGDVAIYLNNKLGEKVLVYTNVGQTNARPNLITGAAIGSKLTGGGIGADSIPDGSILIDYGRELPWPGDMGSSAPGSFVNTCVESCYLNPEQFTQSEFELQVFVEPGTTVKITEIFYTID